MIEFRDLEAQIEELKRHPLIRLVNGMAAWRCDGCQTYNFAGEARCLKCDQPYKEPDVSVTQAAKRTKTKASRKPSRPLGWEPAEWSACNTLAKGLDAVAFPVSMEDLREFGPEGRAEVSEWLDILSKGPSHHARLPECLRGKFPLGWKRPGAGPPAEPDAVDIAALNPALKTKMDQAKSETAAGPRQELLTGDLVPSPTNPRKTFTKEAIETLAQSIKNVGILQSLLVRPHADRPGKYEIIAGERRYRAAKAAGLKMVPVEIRDITDEEVLEAQLIENLEREQLNPIEEAIAFQQLVETSIYSERTLATRLKLSQGHISNRIRLLKLPEAWQKKVISGEISVTDGRDIARWADRPAVLKFIEKEMKHGGYREWYLRRAVEEASRPINGEYYDSKTYRRIPVALTKKEKEREDLDIEEVKNLGKRAFNVMLWEELQAAGLKRREERQTKGANGKASNGKPTLSPTEAKRNREQKAQQWKKRLYRYKVQWLQRQIGERLDSLDYADAKNEALLWRAALVLMGSSDTSISVIGQEIQRGGGRDTGSIRWRAAQSLPDDEVMAVVHRTLKRTVLEQDVESYRTPLRAEDIEGLAEDLGIDIKRDWQLDEEFLKLHTKDQLQELASEWYLPLPGALGGKRGDIIKSLLTEARSAKCPKELASIKPQF